MDRPVRALALLQKTQTIPRGTIQTIFLYETYDEIRRQGLKSETEKLVRECNPKGTGMLTVSKPVKEGPGSKYLKAGDILVRVNNQLVLTFIQLEEILDNSIGNSIEIEIDRGGESLTFHITVQDLYSITPNSCIEFGGGVVHQLSYHQAINYMVPVAGVVVSTPGYLLRRAGIAKRCVIVQLGNTPVPDLDAFEKAISSYPMGSFVPIKYWSLDSKNTMKVAILQLDFRWHIFSRFTKITQGNWEHREIQLSSQQYIAPKQISNFPKLSNPMADRISKSFVVVKFSTPYQVSGVPYTDYKGTGVIVDETRGLVVVDKETVPFSLGAVTIIIAGSIEVNGEVRFVHPIQNFTIVSYDPKSVCEIPLKTISYDENPLDVGDQCYMVGLNSQGRTLVVSSFITQIEPLDISPSAQFRPNSCEVVHIDHSVRTIGGVLCTQDSKVKGFWFCFRIATKSCKFYGLSCEIVTDIVERLKVAMDAGEELTLQSLEVEMKLIPEYQARHQGLSQEWVDRLQEHDVDRRQVLQVRRTIANSPAATVLKEGDILLAINGKYVTRFRDYFLLSQKEELVKVTIWREMEELSFDIETVKLSGLEPKKLVVWSGAFIQESYRELLLNQKDAHEGVYVSRYFFGSPAQFYGLTASCWITEVNAVKTPTLDALLKVIGELEPNSFARISTTQLSDKEKLITLKPNLKFWPTVGFCQENGKWRRFLP